MASDITYANEGTEIMVHTDKGLQQLLEKYQCKDKEELDDLFWYTYGVQLIDLRNKGEREL